MSTEAHGQLGTQPAADRWSEYERMARHLAPAAQSVAEAVDAPTNTADTLLDIGTGPGTAALHTRGAGWHAIGIDVAREQLADATGNRVPSVLADGQCLPFPADSFGGVISNFGLIFAKDPELVLAEARRCLTAGGALAFTAWTPDGWPGALRNVLAPHCDIAPTDFPTNLGHPDGAIAALERAGFNTPTVHQCALSWHFADIDDAVETLTTAAGGLRLLRRTAERLGTWPQAKAALSAEVASRSEPADHPDGLTIRDPYLLVVASTQDPPAKDAEPRQR